MIGDHDHDRNICIRDRNSNDHEPLFQADTFVIKIEPIPEDR